MRQFNISADSYKGQKIKNKDLALFNGHQIEIEPTDIILNNDSVFKNEEGVVSKVMREIYSERKNFKGKMMSEHEKLEQMKEELKEIKKSLK